MVNSYIVWTKKRTLKSFPKTQASLLKFYPFLHRQEEVIPVAKRTPTASLSASL